MQSYLQQLSNMIACLQIIKQLVRESLPMSEQTYVIDYIDRMVATISQHQAVMQRLL